MERGILLKIKMLELSSLKTNNVGEVEIDSLRRQLEETQLAMERMITSMGSDRLAMLAKVLKAQGVCCVSLLTDLSLLKNYLTPYHTLNMP